MESNTTWDKIAERIATETIFNYKQAMDFVSNFELYGANADVYGERLLKCVSSACSYNSAIVFADMVFLGYLQDVGIDASKFTHY